jgi:hypothetical protein
MIQNQVVVIIFDNLFLVNVVMNAQTINEYFYLGFVFLSIKHFVKAFPNGVVHNVTLLNNDILVQLNKINHAPDIRFVQILDGVYVLISQINPLFNAYLSDKLANLLFRKLVETDTHKFMLQRKFNLADIVANQEKLHIVPARLQQILERLLCVFGHIIHLVQNHEFVPGFKQVFGFHKLVNLVANDINASLVGRVQMNDQTFVFLDSLVLVDQIDDGGGFAGPGRAVQQQIGEILVFNHIHEKGLVVWIKHNIVKIAGAILFGPGDIFVH